MTKKRNDYRSVAAPCGLFCGACSIYQAANRGDSAFLEAAAVGIAEMLGHTVMSDELDCQGCLSDVRAVQCRECVLRDCATSKGLIFCSQCSEFPCQPLIDFSNDGFAHHTEVLDNIRDQKEIGIDAWIEKQQQRWRCPDCGDPTDWYAAHCHKCGRLIEDHF